MPSVMSTIIMCDPLEHLRYDFSIRAFHKIIYIINVYTVSVMTHSFPALMNEVIRLGLRYFRMRSYDDLQLAIVVFVPVMMSFNVFSMIRFNAG